MNNTCTLLEEIKPEPGDFFIYDPTDECVLCWSANGSPYSGDWYAGLGSIHNIHPFHEKVGFSKEYANYIANRWNYKAYDRDEIKRKLIALALKD